MESPCLWTAMINRVSLDFKSSLSDCMFAVRHTSRTIIDKATYTQPAQYRAGVEYVMVNGTLVLDKGEIVQGVFPGQAIKAN